MRVIGIVFGLIFGLAFAGGGVFVAMETAVPTYRDWQSMQAWQETTGALLSLKSYDNDTEAKYSYRVKGVAYTNDRVYVSTFKDNIGSYHQDLYQRLKRMKDTKRSITVWYDPDNPSSAVIDRDMRWGFFAFMVGFCSIFIVIGLAVAFAFMFGKSKQPAGQNVDWSVLKSRMQQYREGKLDEVVEPVNHTVVNHYHAGNQPWMKRKQWQQNRIVSNAKSGMIGIWIFAIIWNAVSSPILFVLGDELDKDNYAALIGLLFPLIGIIMLIVAVRMTLAWRQFGVIELIMDPFPGAVGGHVGGSLLVKNVFQRNAEYKVELECVYSYMSGSGDDRSRRENIKWAEAGLAKVEMIGGNTRLKFRFNAPDNLPESDVEQKGDYYFWRLKVKADLDGVDLNRSYNIPVYKTGEQSNSIKHDISEQVEERREYMAMKSQAAISMRDFSSTPLARVMRYKKKGREQVFYFPMFRNKLLTFFALIFAGGFDFAVIAMNESFSADGVGDIFMLLFSIPFALVGLFSTIAVIYLPLNNLTVTLGRRQLTVVRRLLFFPIKYKRIRADEIASIEVKKTGSTGQGSQQVQHFKLIVHTRKKNKITIAEDIDGFDLAHQLKSFIEKQQGVG